MWPRSMYVLPAPNREILESCLFMNAPGQSGRVGSPHFHSFLPYWSSGGLLPLMFNRTSEISGQFIELRHVSYKQQRNEESGDL